MVSRAIACGFLLFSPCIYGQDNSGVSCIHGCPETTESVEKKSKKDSWRSRILSICSGFFFAARAASNTFSLLGESQEVEGVRDCF
jgi:hypothetical protein